MTLHVRVYIQAYYDSAIEVPDDLSLADAFNYAKENLDKIPLTQSEYIEDSDELDDEDLDNPNHTYFSN